MQADRGRAVGSLFSPATGTWIRAIGPLTWCLKMLLFQAVHTEEGLAATEATGEAEVPTGTAGEAEASSMPTRGPALSLSTEDMGERVTLVSSSENLLFLGDGGHQRWGQSLVFLISLQNAE